MSRLRSAALGSLDPAAVPAYDRATVVPGIVHFGVGNFHRAHEAMYLDRVLGADPSAPWGICGVGVLPSDARMRDVLQAQDGLYTLVAKHPDGRADVRVIGSIVEYLFAPEQRQAVLERLAAPTTRIVSLTITEGGYLVDDATGTFDLADPGIAADLVPGAAPATVFGLITEGLRRRRAAGVAPFTVLSCDNIQGNGHVARTALTAFARAKDPELGAWIDSDVPFPNSMVDRITPVTTQAGIDEVRATTGLDDGWPVLSEGFEQWVLEDRFPLGRPDLAAVGVQLVDDVVPYEAMKLRMLNAAHQAMSYLGILAGYTTVHEVCRTPLFADFLRGYMVQEAVPTLAPVPGIDLGAYREQLIARFSSEAIADTLARQVVDASDRIPKFLLPVLADRLAAGGSIDHAVLVLAAWSRWLEALDERGEQVPDRRAALVLAAVRREASEPGAFLDVAEVFGDLGRDPRLRAAFVDARARLARDGVLATVQAVVAR